MVLVALALIALVGLLVYLLAVMVSLHQPPGAGWLQETEKIRSLERRTIDALLTEAERSGVVDSRAQDAEPRG